MHRYQLKLFKCKSTRNQGDQWALLPERIFISDGTTRSKIDFSYRIRHRRRSGRWVNWWCSYLKIEGDTSLLACSMRGVSSHPSTMALKTSSTGWPYLPGLMQVGNTFQEQKTGISNGIKKGAVKSYDYPNAYSRNNDNMRLYGSVDQKLLSPYISTLIWVVSKWLGCNLKQ